jgi:hypothetical protein
MCDLYQTKRGTSGALAQKSQNFGLRNYQPPPKAA